MDERSERRKLQGKQYRDREKVYAEWRKTREKAQQYKVREVMDEDGDIMWSLSGPNVGFTCHSIDRVRLFLTREGVEWRAVKFEPYVWPGAPEANEGSG